MNVAKQLFHDKKCCEGCLPTLGYLFGEADEMDYDVLIQKLISMHNTEPLPLTTARIEEYMAFLQTKIGQHELIDKFANVENSSRVWLSKNVSGSSNIRKSNHIKNSSNIVESENLENCHCCRKCTNSKNLIFCNDTHDFNSGFAICNRIVSKERFEEIKSQLGEQINLFEFAKTLPEHSASKTINLSQFPIEEITE